LQPRKDPDTGGNTSPNQPARDEKTSRKEHHERMTAPSIESAASAQPPENLPDLTQVPEEERDAMWVERYYRGDHVPQLTLRAVLMGGILGAVMAVSNLYTTLKLGWAFGVAITACVLSYAIWNGFVALGIAKTNLTILENNCMQSTASAAGYSTGGTLATAVGAMLLITGDEGRLGWFPVAVWVALTAALGVFLAIPMKRQMINAEQLPFPSGIAAAETLRSLYAQGRESLLKARALMGALLGGIVVAWVRSFGVIPEQVPFQFTVFSNVAGRPFTGAQIRMWFEPSLLLIAAGMIVGLRISTWMFVGSLINQLVLTPQILSLPTWQEEGRTFIGHMEAFFDGDRLLFVHVTRWSLWLGTALLVTSGLTSFALGYKTILRAVTQLTAKKVGAENADPVAHLEVPMSWFLIGMVPITIGLVLLCWFSFGISPVLGVVSVLLSFVLSLVACRATGETDTTPIGALGKITQFIYAVLAPGNTTVNLMTAGITAGAAGSSADLLTDLKSGYLLGAHPRKQFLAQLSGVAFGVPAVVLAWYLLVPNRAALEAFNPPATSMWYAVAQALARGIDTIPESARIAIVIGGLVGIVLALLEGLAPKTWKPFVPSSMGLGLAFVVPFANALSFFIGAVIGALWMRSHKATAERYIIPLASGAVAGESLAAALYAMLAATGVVGGH
jgi:OPT family oligopeptide transporter